MPTMFILRPKIKCLERNAETLFDASNKVGLKITAEKTGNLHAHAACSEYRRTSYKGS